MRGDFFLPMTSSICEGKNYDNARRINREQGIIHPISGSDEVQLPLLISFEFGERKRTCTSSLDYFFKKRLW